MPDGPRDLDSLRAAVAACRLCGDLVTPPGVIWARPHHRAAIIGQAPGSLEVTRQMPFVGPAGRRLREWLAPLGAAEEAAFHERFAVIAITKCYPGRSPSGRGDRLPSPAERLLCRPWSETALRLLDPPLVIPVGRLAVDEWLGPQPLAEVVGRRFELDGRAVIPLPHPSGASAWANIAEHRELIAQAVALIGAELERLGLQFKAARQEPIA